MDSPDEVTHAIERLEALIENPSAGLPEDLFLLITRLTPMVNVDLLIKNSQKHTLLTWRDDKFFPPGWHVPGGIIRYKERAEDRIRAVAANELGAEVSFAPVPLAVNQVILDRQRNRAHFISLLYQCSLTTPLDPRRECQGDTPAAGQWAWHATCPTDLIEVHRMYRPFMCGVPNAATG